MIPKTIITFLLGSNIPHLVECVQKKNSDFCQARGIDYKAIRAPIDLTNHDSAGEQAEVLKACRLIDEENVMVIDWDVLLINDLPDLDAGHIHCGTWKSGNRDGFIIYSPTQNYSQIFEEFLEGINFFTPWFYDFLGAKSTGIWYSTILSNFPAGCYHHFATRCGRGLKSTENLSDVSLYINNKCLSDPENKRIATGVF